MRSPRFAIHVGVAVGAMLLVSGTQQLRAQVQGAWTLTGNMSTAHDYGAQATLNDGTILMAGGTDGTNVLSSAEVYSPSSGTWTPAGPMTDARQYFPAVTLPSGQVLITGGLDSMGNVLAGAELYDPISGTWSPAGALTVARYFHTATLLQSGEVLVTGGCTLSGCGAFTAASEIYDPATNVWRPAGSLGMARWYHTATLLGNGQVLVVGGANRPVQNSSELYDPVADAWSSAPNTISPRFQHAATLLASGKVLVTGGHPWGVLATAEIYDPSTNLWTATGNMTQARFAHTSTLLPDGTVVLAAGGALRGCGRTVCAYPTATSESYNEATGKFTALAHLNQARYYHTATLLGNGRVLVVGGVGSLHPLGSAEFYIPLTLSIKPLSLNFGQLMVGLTSPPQTISVTNVSGTSVTFTAITPSADYGLTHDCPTTLGPTQTCTLTVTFSPAAAGPRPGSVTLSDDSVGSPEQTIALNGIGEPGALSFSPDSIAFPATLPGTSSGAISTTLYNDSFAVVNITLIDISPSNVFSQTNDCPAALNPGQHCTFLVVFTPPGSDAPFSGTLTVTNDGPGSPETVSLSGTGID
jgi:hypothetical protein